MSITMNSKLYIFSVATFFPVSQIKLYQHEDDWEDRMLCRLCRVIQLYLNVIIYFDVVFFQ